MDSLHDETLWSNIAQRLFMNTVSHPIEYAKVLIQIGYEPIPPRPTTTLFRQPALALPNVFQYIGYIKRVDGFTGCYRGLIPKLCAYTISTIAFEQTSKYITSKNGSSKENDDDDDSDDDDSTAKKKCIFEIIRELISRMVGIIVSHPLDVITLRMMAQFVGRETKYSGIYQSFIEVYRENGIMGYYAGVVPRLIGNAAVVVLVGTSTYFINKYLIRERDLKPYTACTMRFLATTITYPFLVVSHCMAVNSCGLAAGLPPHMPIYDNWTNCWSHLSANGQLKRGNSLLWRYYTGPQVVVGGKGIAPSRSSFHAEK